VFNATLKRKTKKGIESLQRYDFFHGGVVSVFILSAGPILVRNGNLRKCRF